ncbi:MAG: methyltransferase domain-containing protein [Deltaproteobacteria bacterium]|nr:methyltransferase domain-containing protein [Deltaproteobacteria bacterium]
MNDDSIEKLLLVTHGAAAFQILHAACESGLFLELHERPGQDRAGIALALGFSDESLRVLLFGLSALGLVRLRDGWYENSPTIQKLFAENEWQVFQKLVAFQAHIVYAGQVDFLESLRQDRNVGLRHFLGSGSTLYERLALDPKLQKIFYDYMEAYSAYAVPHLLKEMKLAQGSRVLDVGGGLGGNAMAVAEKFPHTQVTVLDLPNLASPVQEAIRRRDLSERVTFHGCDFLKDQFPNGHDCIMFNHQLVIWNAEQNLTLLRKAYSSLKSGGYVSIFSSIADDNEKGPLMAALDTVYFRSVAAGRGMIYPWSEYRNWLHEAGFENVTELRCQTWTPHGVMFGYKK